MITWDTYKKHIETVDNIVNSKDIRPIQESLMMTSDGSDSSVK